MTVKVTCLSRMRSQDGYDNSERALRHIVIGRKNWLFAGSDAGAHRAAILYSLVGTCKRHHMDPFQYLRDVITQLTNHPDTPPEQLLPTVFAAGD